MLARACIIALSLLALPVHAAPARKQTRPKRAPVRPAATKRAASKPAPNPALRTLRVQPAAVQLDGKGAEQALLVTGVSPSGAEQDLTHTAQYVSTNPKIAQVSKEGLIRISGDGTAGIVVKAGGRQTKVIVQARNSRVEPPVSFSRDVVPVLIKAGCYAGACHAKQGGQSGFQLSVLAFDPENDYRSIVEQAGGRRINRLEPGKSLLLLKGTLALPHGGGQRFDVDSPEYRLLARWIAEGSRSDLDTAPALLRVEVLPTERVLKPSAKQQLLATAVFADGSRRDITRLAEYQSNEESIAEMAGEGLVQASKLTGEAAVMVRFLGQVAVARFTVPLQQPIPPTAYHRLPAYNFIDDLVYRKLQQLNLLPSETCDDATFLRRASLDLIGTAPTPAEVREFLKECAAEGRTPALKTRAKWVDRLLERPEYADYWGMRWVNLLLVDRDPLFPKGAFAYDRWIREAFRQNMPFDQFAREIVTASGETYRNGPANFYRALATPVEQAKSISQLFLGVRIDCAQCHHHPSERWSQDDFYSMAAFFAQVRRKGSREFEQIVYTAPTGDVKHPKTDAVMPPKPLGAPAPEIPAGEDRRQALAQWMTAPDNPYFARAITNRLWGLLMGRGLVEPVDDFRVSNPATNEPLLDALAKDFVSHGYDLKHLLRNIVNSAAYQRSSRATPNNARDTHNYSRFYSKKLVAEVLLDTIGQVTGVPETFSGHPHQSRAIQLWDNKLSVEFLNIFGRPSRLSVCECDRPTDGSVTQMLHLMNSPAIHNRLTSNSGTVARLEKSDLTPEAIVEELYLTVYCRLPSAEERQVAVAAFNRAGVTRRTAIEDLLWALLNTPEFLLNH